MYYSYKELGDSVLVKNKDTIKVYVGDAFFIKTKHKNLEDYDFEYSNDILKIDAKGDSVYVCTPQSVGMGGVSVFASTSNGGFTMVELYLNVVPKTYNNIIVTSDPTYTIIANNDSIKQLINNELDSYALKKWTWIQLTYNTIWGGTFSFCPLAGDSISGKFASSTGRTLGYNKTTYMTMGYNNITYDCILLQDTEVHYDYTVEQNLTDLFKAKYPNKVDSVAIFTKASIQHYN